uniref:Retrovirus-related Pol polyprotein from transposon TNT 1-94 n=1 Tax=Tanacetum cinerariifolium TaxID=118510 RepID=A0A6L2J4D9_TANCI|nr:retrovirus-related Pol polyprotein from transposon TNT 1-94 [Tanacetum cinerariifolium]
MAAINNVPQLVDKKRGNYSAVASRLEPRKFNKQKKRMLHYLTGMEPYYIQCIKDGPFKPKAAKGDDKPESQWTSEQRRMVNHYQRLKIIIISCLPYDIIESVISCETSKSTWTNLVHSFEVSLRSGLASLRDLEMPITLKPLTLPISIGGNGLVQVSTDTNGQIKVLPPKTSKEILARERERKAKTTLLMAIPEDHLAKFHKMTDAKEMWEAIKSRFSGNDESKKMQKYLLKQQFKSFSVSNSEGLHKSYDRFRSLLSQLETHGVDTLNFDDLYNNLRVFESDVKGFTGSSSSTQNVAFVSSDNTNSTNEVNTTYGVSTSSRHNSQKEGSSSHTHDLIDGFKMAGGHDFHKTEEVLQKDMRKLHFDAKEPVGFDKSKVKCFNCHNTRHFAKEYRSKGNQDSRRRDAKNTGYKARDNTGHAEDETEDYALMAFNSNNSGSDTKMSAKDKSRLGYGSQIHDVVLSYENEVFASVFDSRSSDVEDSLVNDIFAKVEGMHAVPPHMTWNYMPHKSNFGIDESKFTYSPKQSITSESNAKTSDLDSRDSSSIVETLESIPKPVANEPKAVSKPKVWSDAPIIEEYESDSDDEHVTLPSKEQKKPSFAFVNIVEHVKTPRKTVKEQNTCSQNPKPNKRDRNGLMYKRMGLLKRLALTMDETSGILKDFIRQIENQLNQKVRTIRCDNGIEFKNRDIIEFCGSKGIKREYNNARTPQQNRVAERKNMTLVEAARTMLANLFLPNTFWAEAVSTACYVLNRPITAENKADYTVDPKETNNSAARAARASITNYVNTTSTPVNAASTPLNTANTQTNQDDTQIPALEDIYDHSRDGIFTSASYDNEGAVADFTNLNTTMNISQALEDESWVDATQEELLQFKIQKVWILVDLPFGKKGHRQEEGIYYHEVFAPVARIEVIRIFLAFTSYMGFIVYQMDVKSAFLYGKIDEEVYVSQTPGFIDPKFPNKVYKVVKALYGLHHAPKAWYATLSTLLVQSGYRRGLIDKTLFIKKDKKDIMLVQVYVDDIIFGSTKKSWCDEFEALMKNMFRMSSMGELTFFLGLQVKQKEDGILISQDKYVVEIPKKFDFLSVKTASTPIETKKPLVKDEEAVDVDVHLYRSMIGSLIYLTASKPDIMYAVCACSRFQVTPKTSLLQAVKRIFRYLKGQPKLGLWYPRESAFDLEAYSDSDYAGANLDRKSTTEVLIVVNTTKDKLILLLKVNAARLKLTTAKVYATKEKPTESEEFAQIIDFLNGSSVKYALTASPTIYTLCIKQFWTSAKVKTVNDVVRIQALVDGKRVNIKKSSIRRTLRLNDAEAEQTLHLPSNYPLPSGKDSLKLKELMDLCTNLSNKVLELESEVIDIKSTYQERIEKLEGRVEWLEEENRRRKIADIDDDVEINLEKAQAEAYNLDLDHQEKVLSMMDVNEEESADVEEVLEVVKAAKLMTEVVTTAGATKVSVLRNRRGVIIQDPEETTTTTTVQPKVQAKDKGKAILIEEPKPLKRKAQIELDEEVARQLQEEQNAVINWNDVIKQVKRNKRLNDAVMKYQTLKRKPLTQAQTRRNMIVYLKNMVGFKMDYFKGMTYDEIRPLFEKHYNYNQAFLDEVNKEVKVSETEVRQEKDTEVESYKTEGESLKQEIAKKQKIEEETEELKKHFQIVIDDDDDDDVYTDATPLASKIPIIDYKIHTERNRPYFKIIRADGNHMLFISLSTMLKNFDREDLESLWIIVKDRFEKTKPKNYLDDYLLNTLKSCLKSLMLKLVCEKIKKDKKEVSDDEETTQVKVLMALADDELLWERIMLAMILKSKEKPYPPCTQCSFNDHRLNDCRNYVECEIRGSYGYFTSGHNHVIHVRGGVLAESFQSNTHVPEVITSNAEDTPHTEDVEGPPDLINTEGTQLQEIEPKKASEALKHLGWVDAMQEELNQFYRNKVWTLVPLSYGKITIGSKWVFRNKKDKHGIVTKNKARLVAQGYSQEEGINYDEPFAPVARMEAIKMFLAFATYMNFIVFQMNIKSAFLNGKLKEF